MDLYFSRKKEIRIQLDWHNSVKVVACPFCGVSTSTGEIITVISWTYYLLFQCLTCQKTACLLTTLIEKIEKKEVEKNYPHDSVADNAEFYMGKLHKIDSVSCTALRPFCTISDISNDDVITFYNDLEKFGHDSKIDINDQINDGAANKFLKGNKLAEKYNIRYGQWSDGEHLVLRINDYYLSSVPFRGYMIVTCGYKNDNDAYIVDNLTI